MSKKLTKKIKLTYKIRDEVDLILANYARARGQTRTDIVTQIIEAYLTCKKSPAELEKNHKEGAESNRKDWSKWKSKGDYLIPSHHEKIQIIANTLNVSASEVMDDILSSYLEKINPKEALKETLAKVFG